MFRYHIIALFIGTILEVFLGRIYGVWSPFDTIKKWIKYLDRALLGDELILLEPSKQKSFGMWLVILVLAPVFVLIVFFTVLAYDIAPAVGVVFEAICSYICLDANYNYFTSKEIVATYFGDGIEEARKEAATFTGEDTLEMEEKELVQLVATKTANEAADSSISPLFVMFLFGPIGGFLYKTIDLMDSMVGHHDNRYEYFGYYPARLNQIVDYIPGRFSGMVALFCARHTFGGFNGKNARFIHLRDKYKSVSAFAGALEVSLKNGTIGDEDKTIEPNDIRKAASLHRNMFITCQIIFIILLVFF
ncbi:MAG: cobalamin biosynthesis protein [Pseudobutyrivibrio sp.]|nr:cobalamin biosynthesis protein [Pseudobutyrivibrio sp.]